MAIIKIWDDVPIDTSSQEIKSRVSQSISNYIIKHWDKCVYVTSTESGEKYEAEFSITL